MEPISTFSTSYVHTLSTEHYDLDNEMTCSKIIELLEPSVRESMKMRKLSMNTELIKSNGRKVQFTSIQLHGDTQAKSSLIISKNTIAELGEGRNTFEDVMNESMIGVVNMPHSGSKPQTVEPAV
jgi:Fic family protein